MIRKALKEHEYIYQEHQAQSSEHSGLIDGIPSAYCILDGYRK